MAKTSNEIIASMSKNMGALRPDIDLSTGTIVSDINECIADELENNYVDISHTNVLGSLLNYNLMSVDEMNDLVSNYGITRKPATSSSGLIYFRTSSPPTQDINIPIGFIVTTQPDSNQQTINFSVTEAMTIPFANYSDYYNSVSGFYEIGAPITAVTEGSTGNVGVGSITVMQGSVNGIQNIYNYSAFTNGLDVETNQALSSRTLLAIQGASAGTEDGYIANLLSNVNVYDAKFVGPGDTLMVRDNGVGGKIDLYVKIDQTSTAVYSEVTDVFVYSNSNSPYYFINQPVKNVVSITGSITGIFNSGMYTFTKDTGNLNNSIQALDKIVWNTPPQVGETVTIVYNYFSILQTLTTSIQSVRPVDADVLIRLATQVNVNVTLNAYYDSTIITDSVAFQNAIITEIQTYLTFKNLAGKVEQAMIVNDCFTVTGTSNIGIPFTLLSITNSGVSDITFAKNQYSYPGTITVNPISS